MPCQTVGATEQVIRHLKQQIESGAWPVGQKIPSENALTRSLGVSRASVRAAIGRFAAIGVLESQHGRGTFVRSGNLSAFGDPNRITPEDCADLRQVLEYRRVLETEACALAARRATPALLAELRARLDGMAESVGDPERFVREDRFFHEALCRASGNHLLEKSLRDVFANTARDHRRLNEIFGYKDGLYYHRLILEAVGAGKPAAARRLMREHLQQAIDALLAGGGADGPPTEKQ